MYARIPTINTSNTVARTIANKVIGDLKSNLSIDERAFIALENIFEQKTFNSGVNVPIDRNEYETPLAEKITAKIENTKLTEYNVGSLINKGKELFRNSNLVISTEFVNYEMSLTITYMTKSKVNAEELVNYLKDNAITRGLGYIHAIDYYYLFPNTLLGLMEDVFNTGKTNTPNDTTTFIDFIKGGNILNAIVVTSDINGYDGDVGLAAVATNRVQGLFEVDIKDTTKEFDKDTAYWSVPVSYKLNYISPDSFIVDYSLLINNSMLPNKYYIQKSNHATDPKREKDPLYQDGFIVGEYKQDYVSIPPYDNHKVSVQSNSIVKPILSVLSAISLTDLKTLFSLNDLYYYKIKDEYLAYIVSNYSALVKPMTTGFDSIFTLDIYAGGKLLPKNTITIDSNLNISAVEDLDITNVYRIVLSCIVDLNMLTPIGVTSISNLGIIDELASVLTRLKENDYRLVDSTSSRYIVPITKADIVRTAQTTIIETFFK